MSDISIPGVSSKYNTPQLIENLMKVERKKLETFETEKTGYQELKTIWQGMNRKMGTLREAARYLYGFDNPFQNKIGTSGDPQAFTINATRQAQNGTWSLKVLQVAAADRFLSKELPLDQNVPAGNYNFTVGDKSVNINFRGGKLSSLAEAINQKPEGLLRASVVKNSQNTQVFLIESTQVGQKNALGYNPAARELFLNLGILGPNDAGQIKVLDGQQVLKPGENKELPLNSPLGNTGGLVLEGKVAIKNLTVAPVPPAPPGLNLPGAGSVNFEGIVIQNDPLENPLPAGSAPKVPSTPVVDLNLVGLKDGTRTIPLPPMKDQEGEQSFSVPLSPLTGRLSGITLENRNTLKEVTYSSLVIRNPLETGDLKPLNPLSRAQDSLVEMDGIKIQRPNNALDDLVAGVTFNLERTTDRPVTAEVKPDIDSIKNAIISLVGNYNQFLTDILVYTSNNPAVIEESYLADPKMADQKKQAYKDLGKFQGDLTLNQMKNAFQRIFMDPYPTNDGSGLNILSQIGISTNATGANGSRPDATRLRGYLEINEGKLDQNLKDNFLSVKKLFGQDTSGDLVVDRGVAFSLDEYIRPYTELGGLIAKRLSTLDGQISQTDKKIREYNDYLVRYETDLKRKYGAMESSLNSMQSSFDRLENFNRQNQGGN